jgi:arginine-tRNA-protein transferase
MNYKSRGTISPNTLAFFASEPHACSYLPQRDAITVFADPYIPMNSNIYSKVAEYGFRRSGEYVYAPRCNACCACISVRIPAQRFVPTRSQKRTYKRNSDLQVTRRRPVFQQEHFELYSRYIGARHKGGGMDNPIPDEFLFFLTSSWSDTWFYEFRSKKQLLSVAVVDQLSTGMSAVYTYFEPAMKQRGLGVYAILWLLKQLHATRQQWLYLGYYIEECEKMKYKSSFRPLQAYIDGSWREYPRGANITD